MSSNSATRSKRSANSASSKRSSTGSGNNRDNKKQRKMAGQKTLGMAWGANSRASSLSDLRSPFSDFGSYMAVKNQKLHEQFDAAASSSSTSGSRSVVSLFCGVSIFVDGYTIPSSQELRGYMLKYGGRFENYFSRHRVTHIICSNLPDSKIKNLRAFSGGLPVVKPSWVLDSVAANKLLSWIPYQLDHLATKNNKQPKLSTFFNSKDSGVSEVSNSLVEDHVICEDENQHVSKMDLSSGEECASVGQVDTANRDDLLKANMDKEISEESADSAKSSYTPNGVELSNALQSDNCNSGFKQESTTCQTSVSHCGASLDASSNAALGSGISFPSNQRHSTLADPNFVENYFKSSRLHFIGTWRSRYRKRFPSMLYGFKHRTDGNAKEVGQRTNIIHVDMDCFFVSVVIRNRADLLDKPVAVCHSDNPRGTAEISSANYPARDHGVKAGMFVKEAKARCPQLLIVPYDFEAYEKVADQFYDILHKHCNKVQAVSCDEAFLDISESEVEDPQLLASIIRKEIEETTGCTASAGIAANILVARLATRSAKPNGQCCIPPEEVDNYLQGLPVKALPGIGYVLGEKLKQKKIVTCGQLRLYSKESLQKDFGTKTGEMLWNYSRGIDPRSVGMVRESKSIGAEVNWGVRFRDLDDAQHFLRNLCKEVAMRLQGCGVQGRSFTLRIKKRKTDASEPIKYMGCGDCENYSHTIKIPMATDDVDVLQRLATQLFGHFNIDVRDIRGVGLQVTKLQEADDTIPVPKRNSILSWLRSTPTAAGPSKYNDSDTSKLSDGGAEPGSSVRSSASLSSFGVGSPRAAIIPPLQDLDLAVIESLPPELVSEINDMYGGKLLGFISENKRKADWGVMCPASPRNGKSAAVEETESFCTQLDESNQYADANENDLAPAHLALEKSLGSLAMKEEFKEMNSCEEAAHVHFESASFSPTNLMPSSLSQVDRSVLQQLPDDLKKDIMKLLPLHRELGIFTGSPRNVIDEQAYCAASMSNDLWTGNPPKWVDGFKLSNSLLLTNFANAYQSQPGDCMSSILQRIISHINSPVDVVTDGSDDVTRLCELFKQYIDLKIETDIEEIYLCFSLLRRSSERSELFSQVYNVALPYLQESMGEKYGGTLNISPLNN